MGAEASFSSTVIGSSQTSGDVREAEHSFGAGSSAPNDLKCSFLSLKRSISKVYAIFPCTKEDAHLTVDRARWTALKFKEEAIDEIIIIGNELQVKLPERILATVGVPYSCMQIFNKSHNLLETMRFGLSKICDAIRKGGKVAGVKIFAPQSKSEEIMQNYRYLKRMPEHKELEGLPIQLMRVKEEVSDKKLIVDAISLHLNPGRHGLASFGRTLSNFLIKQ